MSRVLLVGTEEVKERAVEALYAANLVHMEDYQEVDPYFSMGKPLERGAAQSEKLLKLRSISNYLAIKDADQPVRPVSQVEKELERHLSEVDSKVSSELARRTAVDGRLKEIDGHLTVLRPFIALGIPLELLSGYRSISVFVGTCERSPAAALAAAVGEHELVEAATQDRELVIAAFVPAGKREAAADALSQAGLLDIAVPDGEGDPASIARTLEEERAKLEREWGRIETRLAELHGEYAEFIRSASEHLTTEVERAEAPLRFAQGSHTWACDGWIPTDRVERLREDLERATGGGVHLEVLDAREEGAKDKEIPVAYDNPRVMHPLETFTDLFAHPLYREIDPTLIIFFAIPLFYGFMLGDVAYGAVILAMAVVLNRRFKTPGWNGLLKTMKLAAASSIAFGFVFGEFFGFELFGEASVFGLHDVQPLLYRFGTEGHAAEMAKAWIPMLLVITVLTGVGHMTLGYIIGFRNELRAHGLKKAFFHKASWLFVLLGGTLAVAAIMPALMGPPTVNFTDPMLLAGMGMAVFGVACIIKADGFMGILEVPTLLSNSLSYTRLLAVGLSSVGIAFAINLISLELLPQILGPLLGGILGVVFIVIGHIANTALGILSPGLHSIRLQYVEFFTKFYTGGGRKYDPFGYQRKYTEE